MYIRLLYLTRESHPSFRPDIAVLFGEELPRHGVQTDIVALGESSGAARWAGGQAFTRQVSFGLRRQCARLRVAIDLLRLTRGNRYDAIQVRDRIAGALIALCIARWRGLPFYYWMSFPFPDAWIDIGRGVAASGTPGWLRIAWYLRGQLAHLMLYRVILPRVDHLFVQSEAMQRVLVGYGLDASRMTPVPMGAAFPNEPEAPGRVPDPRMKDRCVLVYIGALERMRHPEIMLEAMVFVVREHPDALLVLVGDSQTAGERAWLNLEIDRLSLQEHAFITGWLPPAQAREFLQHARVGLSPFPRTRIFEVASPTKVCEYLAHGVPVVANDQPDQAYLIRETGGGICVPMTASGFADGICRMLADPDRASEMARLGQQKLKALRSYEVLGQQLAKRYLLLRASQA